MKPEQSLSVGGIYHHLRHSQIHLLQIHTNFFVVLMKNPLMNLNHEMQDHETEEQKDLRQEGRHRQKKLAQREVKPEDL